MMELNRRRRRIVCCTYLCLFCLWIMAALKTEAWVAPSSVASRVASSQSSTTQLRFFGGAPPDDGSPGDYACKDCEFVFTKGPQAWAALPDSYSCPLCGAPKRRFTKVPKGSKSKKAPSKTASPPEPKKKGWF